MAHIAILDSNLGSRIPLHIREHMTICPPPITTSEGNILDYPESYMQRYADLREMKQRQYIYIEEELDDSDDYHTMTNFRMLIRCLSSDADIQVILAAAKHLELVSKYVIKRGENDQLDPTFEISYTEVFYTIGNYNVHVDDYVDRPVFHNLSQVERKRIWKGLFEAAGYKVAWGNALNIKRR